MSLGSFCRVCANTIRDEERARNVFTYMRGKLLRELKLITGVELQKQNNMPERVCVRCISELELGVKFRERCIFSQQYLLEVLKNERLKDEQYFSEIMVDEVNQRSESEDDTKVKKEVMLEEALEKASPIIDVNANIGMKDDIEIKDEVLQEVMILHNAVNEDETMHQLKAQLAQKQLDRLEAEGTIAGRPKNFYMCEQCTQFCSNKNVFKLHLQNHIELPHQCPECSKSFKTKALLKRHSKTHSDLRKHKCKICGEAFVDHHAKLHHEKTHANERPYPCLECGKVFNSAQELRTHFNTHLPLRKFRCEPCNEDFLQREDLITHSSTLLHKRNVISMQHEIDLLNIGVEILDPK